MQRYLAPAVLLICSLAAFLPAEDAAPAPAEAKPPEASPFPVKSSYYAKIEDGYESAEQQEELVSIPLEAMGDILKALKTATPEQLDAAVIPDITFKMLMREPLKYRGQVVQLAGVLRFFRKVGLEDNVSGVTTAWEGQVSNAEGNITTFIAMAPMPETVTLGQGVRLTGVFLKRHGYLNREPGEKLTLCPLIFVRQVEPWSELRHNASSGAPLSFTVMEGLLSVLALVVLVGVFYGRSMKKAQSANVFAKKKEMQEPAKGIFPKPSPHKPAASGPDSGKA